MPAVLGLCSVNGSDPFVAVTDVPNWVRTIRDRFGGNVYEQKVERHEVLDPRINYIMVNLMEDVLRAADSLARSWTRCRDRRA